MAIERYRTYDEPYAGEPSGLRVSEDEVRRPAASREDPLAELARIIGSDDSYRRDLQGYSRPDVAPVEAPAPRWSEPEPAADATRWDDLEAELATFSSRQAPSPSPVAEEPVLDLDADWLRPAAPVHAPIDADYGRGEPLFDLPAPVSTRFAPEPVRYAPEPEPVPQAYALPDPVPAAPEPVAYVSPDARAAYAAFEARRETWQATQAEPAPVEEPLWLEPAPAAQVLTEPADPAYYAPASEAVWPDPVPQEEPAAEPVADMMYAPPRRRSGAALAIGAVVGLTLLGGGGYAAYRVMKPSTSLSGDVKVIKADPEPAKVAGPAAVENAKRVQDRVPAGPEQVVAREEKPLSLREQSAQIQAPPVPQGPRVISLSPVADRDAAPADNAAVAATLPPPAAAAPVVLPPVAPAMPVASVQAQSADLVAPAASLTMPPATPMPQSRPASMDEPRRVKTVSIGPDGKERAARPAANGSSLLTVPNSASSNAQPRPLAPPPAPLAVNTAGANRASNAPIQLAPPAVASLPARTASAAPAPVSGNGDFMLQLASDKSEAGAQAAFNSMKRKYSALGPYSASFKSVDLGEKGTFVRARIGPFSQGSAAELCSQIKAQGGACIVQRR